MPDHAVWNSVLNPTFWVEANAMAGGVAAFMVLIGFALFLYFCAVNAAALICAVLGCVFHRMSRSWQVRHRAQNAVIAILFFYVFVVHSLIANAAVGALFEPIFIEFGDMRVPEWSDVGIKVLTGVEIAFSVYFAGVLVSWICTRRSIKARRESS